MARGAGTGGRLNRWLRAAARHPARLALGGAVALGVLELGYLGFAPEGIRSRLQEVGSAGGVDVTIEEVTTWYPGDLALEGVRLKSPDCEFSLGEVDGRYSVSGWLTGGGRLRDLTVHGIDLECEAADQPRWELDAGQSELSLAHLARRGSRVDFGEARLDLDGATLRVGPRAVLNDLQGEIAVSDDGDGTGPYGGISVRAELTSQRARAPLPSRAAARVVPTDAQGVLDVDLTWEDGRLGPSSRLAFELPSVEYDLRSGQKARLPEGVVLSLTMDEASGKRLWRLSAPRYLRDGGEDAAQLLDVRATLETPRSGAFDPIAGDARLLVSVKQARVRTGGVVLEGRFELDSQLGSGSNARAIEISSGTVEFDDWFVERADGGARYGPSRGELQLEHAGFRALTGFEFDGTLKARGADAQTVLELAATPAVPEWVSERFAGYPFNVEAKVGYGASGLYLRDIELDRGAMRLRGWIRFADGSRHGAVRLDYGLLSLGMRFDGEGSRMIPSPPPDWLGSLRAKCRGHARDACGSSGKLSRSDRM